MKVTSEVTQELAALLTDSVLLTPDSPDYAASVKRWSQSAEKEAGLVVIPATEADISTAVEYAHLSNIDLAVVGGGHATSGSGSTQGGILIDLSRMRKVTVDDKAKTITAQGGCLWENVDRAAGEHHLATVGGVINHTGVGGLTLGGGYGWLSGQYGLVVDNLISARIVIADGRILTVSKDEHADLFWAIRGAGHNFGVVTEFTLQAFDQTDQVSAGLVVFPPDKLEQVIEFANGLVADDTDGRAALYVFLGCPPGQTDPAITTVVFSTLSEEETQTRFAPLMALEPILNTVTRVPYHEVNGMLNPIAAHGDRKAMKGFSYTLPLQPGSARTLLEELTLIIKNDPDLIRSFVVFEGINVSRIAAVPREATAFANRGHARNGGIWMWWTDPERDVAALLIRICIAGDRSPRELFGENLLRLQKLKAEYDPDNVFNKTHPLHVGVND
ncbi:FAD-binding domain-containing protein [Aspergillus heteromorphus CBS 117.55]|uniref:FAD-binding domain-containing protein n=1 Tax=Aspergillus heteromorphus CBS 117.55 TaxID=1448321 RepID=A0A317V4Z5_9EURO|nr:FAD-binding domain-containing protein [Aspergillus heteromorphus CBS 117.55]PWY67937.1 FAD-binding domain-containing protein [Aspergillus heteromorphus CBS 117.55]